MAMSGEKTGEFNDKDGKKPGNLGPHDIGGLEEEYRTIDKSERGFHLWEMQVDFCGQAMQRRHSLVLKK